MKVLCLLLLSFLSLISKGQSEQELLKKADAFETALQEEAALETLQQALKVNPNSYYANWKASELYSRIGKRQPSTAQQQDFFRAGKSYASQAIRVHPSGADGYYAMAVALGRLALSQSGRERINAAKDIRSYAEKALQLAPRHGRAWHVLGKWHYEVTGLNLLEKAALKLIYGGLPPASLEESISAYEKAKLYEPAFALNYLELAKAYARKGQQSKAIELLKKLPALPAGTADDARIKAQGARLLKELTD